jgi:hypothetical protein
MRLSYGGRLHSDHHSEKPRVRRLAQDGMPLLGRVDSLCRALINAHLLAMAVGGQSFSVLTMPSHRRD